MVRANFVRIISKYINICLLFALLILLLFSLKSSDCAFDKAENYKEGSGGDAITHTHHLILISGKPATCTEKGLLECYECTGCGRLYLDSNAENPIGEQPIVPSIPHSLIFHAPTLVDCTVGGYNAYYSCEVCGGLFLDEYGESQIDSPPYVERPNHLLINVPERSPTCNSTGYLEHFKCRDCGKLFSDNTAAVEISSPAVIEKIAHQLIKRSAIPPTCEEYGYDEYYICIECDAYFNDADGKQELDAPPILEKLDHTLTEFSAKQPTCTESGYKNYFVCSECNALFLDAEAKHRSESPEAVAPLPHTPKFIQSQASTCTKHGTKEYYACEKCGNKFSDIECSISLDEIPLLPLASHTTVHHALIESTCTSEGAIEHYKCRVCQQLFANPEGTIKIDSIAIPLTSHIFENGRCINCSYKMTLISYSEYLLKNIGETVSVCGFITAINANTNIIYIQYENYAYKLINARADGFAVGDMIIAVGIKARNTAINCSYVSLYEPASPSAAPKPYNATSLLISNIDNVLNLNQYTYVELNGITLLHSAGNEYLMAYLENERERLIYFTLNDDTPISINEVNLIKSNFNPMSLVSVRGLIYQEGSRLSFIPISSDFISDISAPVYIPPESMLRYESLVCQFDCDTLTADCVIRLNCTPVHFEAVNIRWISQSDSVVISGSGSNGYCTASVKVTRDERITLIAEFSIDNADGDPITTSVIYYLNLKK